jgi:3-methylcrotonyl-CoA carboxylase alpha subunit
MIAKVIVWDEDRSRCINKTLRVLEDTIIFGVKTNIPLLKQILNHIDFRSGVMTTLFFGDNFAEGLKGENSDKNLPKLLEELRKELKPSGQVSQAAASDPFQQSWRIP